MRFHGQVVLVTGAGSGIGRAAVHSLGREGATIVVTDIEESRATTVADELRDAGVESVAFAMDVVDDVSVREVLHLSLTRFGKIDVLVNNAATWPSDGLVDMNEDEWDRDIRVCLKGPFLTCKHVLGHMIARRTGNIVNIASVNGIEFVGAEAYSAAKAGVINLTKAIAARYGPYGVRANAVAPATVRTPIWDDRRKTDPALFERLASLYPLGRVGEAEDVAQAVGFLASEQASWITGVVLPVDGGLLAGRQGFID